jgi:multidrug resistance protein MdtO
MMCAGTLYHCTSRSHGKHTALFRVGWYGGLVPAIPQGGAEAVPGRAALLARMVIASTLVMVISMVFRMPYGAYGAIHAITISRESPQATVKAVKTIVIAFVFAAAASRFGYLVVITTPLWDRHIPANQRVEDTLWAVCTISIASVITALLELYSWS